MSVGNNTQAVNFDNCQLTLVLGHNLDMGGDGSRNGTGKTTIINALSYALYGEALTNIRRDNLINKTNGKGMMTTVDFEIEGKEYRIERGRKPNVLRLLINGEDAFSEEQQGDSRETQKEIEKIIGFPHNMFKHLIALNTYTEPFLSMKNNDQRDMIEQLLGITELSQKAEVLKELMKNTRDSIKEEEFRINAVEESNKRIEKNIKEIESRSKAWQVQKDNKLNEFAELIGTLEEINIDSEINKHKHNTFVTEQQLKLDTVTNEKTLNDRSLIRSEDKLETLKSNLQKALEGVCPACDQSTAHLDTHESYTQELRDKITEEEDYYSELTITQSDIESRLSEIGEVGESVDTFYTKLEDALDHRHNLETLKTQLEEKADEVNPYVEQIEGLKDSGLQSIEFDVMNELTFLDRKSVV